MTYPWFRYTINSQTGRYEVLWKRPDDTETVVGDYATAAEAEAIVEQGNKEQANSGV